MELLKITNCKKSFLDNNVLHDISLTVNEGEVVSILGPSGSGKSTLLRCATLLETMDSGTLQYNGEYVCKDVDGVSVYSGKNEIKRLQQYFGLVFQDFNLFPHMSVMQNIIDAPINVEKRDKKEVIDNAKRLISQMNLEGKEQEYPATLSGGQKQRVAIARALNMNPRILFFDEPTSALDPELTGEILQIIKELAANKMTMVIVTHEINFAKMVSDRVIFMDGGYIVEQGRPKDVIDNPSRDRTKRFLTKMTNV